MISGKDVSIGVCATYNVVALMNALTGHGH